MPRSRSQKNRTKARKVKQRATKPKAKRLGLIAHQPPSGMGLALLAASVLRMTRSDK